MCSKKRLSTLIEREKVNGLGSVLQEFLETAETIYENDLLMHKPKELLKKIINVEDILTWHNTTITFSRTPQESLEIRTAAWSVFKSLVIAKLNETLDAHISAASNELDLHYMGQGIFQPDMPQKHTLHTYIIALTFLLSKHELKDPGSFLEEYKALLPGYKPAAKSKKCSLQ